MINGIGILIGGANQLSLYFKKIIEGFQARVLDDSGIFESFNCMDSSLKTITKPIYEQASLVLTPNGYKEDKLYSAFPKDGSGDLVVTRATTATRVNSDGLIEQVPYNFLQQSQTFDNAAWSKLSVGGASIPVVTANSTTAPDGNLTADKIVFNAPTSGDISVLDQNISLTGTATGSFYIKAFSSTDIGKIIGFRFNSGSYSLVTLTDSWQRVSVTATALTTFDIHLRPAIGTSSGTVSIYLWGAQLVTGTSAKEYFPTTDRLDVPRLDYTNSTCPSILVEPQRTNLLLNSVFNGTGSLPTSWADAFVTGTSAPAVSTKSTIGQAYTFTTSATRRVIVQLLNYVSGTTYSFSVYVENVSGSISVAEVLFFNGTGTQTFYKDGVLIPSSTPVVSGSRYTSIFVASATVTQQVRLGNGCTTTTTGSVRLSMPQLEAGSYATSYIPTVGSTVTRNADVISKTGISNLIGQTEGTLFFDGIVNNIQNAYSNILNTNKDLSLSTIQLAKRKTDNKFRFSQFVGNGTGSNIALTSTNAFANGTRTKIAIRYKSGSFAMYINGNLEATSSDSFTNIGAKTELFLNDAVTYFNYQESVSFNSVVLFTSGLSNSELATLTTI